MPETLQTLNYLPIAIQGFGLFTILSLPSNGWMGKHLNMLSTHFWMILITAGLSIVMVVLFLFPVQLKHQSVEAEDIQ